MTGRRRSGVVARTGSGSRSFWWSRTVLTPPAIVALFVKNQINDTDRYVQTVKPLASNAAIQAYVAEDVSQQLFDRVDIKKLRQGRAARRADVLAGPLTSALQGFVRQAVERCSRPSSSRRSGSRRTASRTASWSMCSPVPTRRDHRERRTVTVTVDLSSVTKLVQERLE